jgi:hypothetical protein
MSWQPPISQQMNWDDWMSQSRGPASPMSFQDKAAQAQMDYFARLPELEQQRIDIAKEAAKPASKWATGTQAFGSVAQGLAGLGSIYLGLQGMKEQKKMNKFNMGMANTNMNNSILDYNRRLEGTLQNRALNNGGGQGYVSEQLARYSARRSG